MTGKHLRHARDHFVLLVDSVSSSDGLTAPNLSYDVRLRNTPMETSRKAAIDSLNESIDRLKEIVTRLTMDQPITLNAVTPHDQVFQTTFGREVRRTCQMVSLIYTKILICFLSSGLLPCMRCTIGRWYACSLPLTWKIRSVVFTGSRHCWRTSTRMIVH